MRVWAGVAGVVAVGMVVGARWWWLSRTVPPTLSVPQEIAEFHPSVQHAIRAAHAGVVDDPWDANAWTELALVYHGNAVWAHAAEAYQRAATLQPDEPRLWYYLGQVRREMNEFDPAIEAMTLAAERAPTYAPAHWRLGLLLLECQRLDEAAAAFERAIEIDPSDPPGALGLARVHLIRGDCDRAISELEQTLVSLRTPQYADYSRHLLRSAHRRRDEQSQPHGALADARPARLQSGPSIDCIPAPGSHPHSTISLTDPWQLEVRHFACSPSARLEFAMELGSAGRMNDAIALLQELKFEPDYNTALVHSNLSMLFRAQGRIDESIRAAEDALRVNPSFSAAHFNLAMAQVAKADRAITREASKLHAAAMQHVNESLAINPTYAPALGLRGQLMARTGRFESALEAFEAAGHCDRQNPLWPLERAKLLIQCGRPLEAIPLLESLAVTAPEVSESVLHLAEAYVAINRVDEAVSALEHAAQLRPRDDSVQQRLRELKEFQYRHGPAILFNH